MNGLYANEIVSTVAFELPEAEDCQYGDDGIARWRVTWESTGTDAMDWLVCPCCLPAVIDRARRDAEDDTQISIERITYRLALRPADSLKVAA